MVAAGAESVSNGGCGPDDTLYLSGDPAEDRPKLEKFLSRFHDAGDSALPLSPALPWESALPSCPAFLLVLSCKSDCLRKFCVLLDTLLPA